jgi:5-methyltetrahydrofolate--homocysteine methyltransferase
VTISQKGSLSMIFDPNLKLTRQNFAGLPPLCLDGAWGTEFQKLGARPGELFDAWNVEAPEKVRAVAGSYVEAGAQVILTNTFSSNRAVLAKRRLEAKVAEFSRAGAEISAQAARGRAYVFASVGPTGKMVMMGEITPEQIEEIYAEQSRALAEGGAHAIVIETQTDLAEARAILRGCMKACALPVGVSFSFGSGEGGAFTMMGVGVAQAYQMAVEEGACFVGANCGAGIESLIVVARLFGQCGEDVPIWIKGNAGAPKLDAEGRTVYTAAPQVFSDAVGPLLEAGARFIGGCCGSGPDHIRAIAQRMASPQP